MKLFLDRNKTLLPRIDAIFLLTRVLVLLGVVWFAIFGDYTESDRTLFMVLPGALVLLILYFWRAMSGRFDIKSAYLSSLVYDIIAFPLFVMYTGNIDSSFFLFFFMTISVAAYVLTSPYALTTVIIVSGIYVSLSLPYITAGNMSGFIMRVGFMWVYYLALTYVSQYLRKSEKRLLKLFNTLNLRTSELEKSQAQLELIYENTRILAGILQPDGVIREAMRIMERTLQYTSYAVVLRETDEKCYYAARREDKRTIFHPKPLKLTRNDLVRKVMQAMEGVRINDLRQRNDYAALEPDTMSVLIIPMLSHGRARGVLLVESATLNSFNDRDEQLVSIVARAAGLAMENAELHKRTEELTVIDELTGAYNYRYFIKKFDEETKRALRYGHPLSIIMIDIDWFKKLNDSYGHEVGNLVLRDLAQIIKRCIRDVDVFARYGGEEFVVILPQTTGREAEIIGERIREQVESNITEAGASGRVKVTVSIGVSSYPENGRSEEELVTVADAALYEAKGSGKNKVKVS